MRPLRVLTLALAAAGGCGAHGNMRVDTPIIDYRAPDISEITGIDESAGSGDTDTGGEQPAKK